MLNIYIFLKIIEVDLEESMKMVLISNKVCFKDVYTVYVRFGNPDYLTTVVNLLQDHLH